MQIQFLVLLSNVIYDGDLNNKNLLIGCYDKSDTENISFKMRIKSLVDGDLIFVPSQVLELSNTYQYYQFESPIKHDEIKQIAIDPSSRLADINPQNNVWSKNKPKQQSPIIYINTY